MRRLGVYWDGHGKAWWGVWTKTGFTAIVRTPWRDEEGGWGLTIAYTKKGRAWFGYYNKDGFLGLVRTPWKDKKDEDC